MWTERPQEELQHFVILIDEALEHTQLDELQAAQYRRVRESIVAHLTAQEVVVAPEVVAESNEVVDKMGTLEPETDEALIEVMEPVSEANTEEEPVLTEDAPDLEPIEVHVIKPSTEAEELLAEELPTPAVTEELTPDLPTETEVVTPDELNSTVESGDEGLWGHARPAATEFVYPDGSRPTNADILLKERQQRRLESLRREDKIVIVRFDPELGTYNEQGRLLVDSTESPVIRKNIDVIIEVAQYIAKFSQETDLIGKEIVLSLPEILEKLGYEHLDPLTQRQLGNELARMLDPTHAVSFFTTRKMIRKIQVRHAFQFIVTDLTPRKSRHHADDIASEAVYAVVAWPQDDRDEVLGQSLINGKVPMPGNHQQAITLLGVVMDNDNFKPELEEAQPAKTSQAVLDIAHTMVQESLGLPGYFEARRARMIRSGQPGTSNTVRFVTGSQRNERFKKGDQAVTAPKERNLP